jgi:hypothetical protein
MNQFLQHHHSSIRFHYSCFDRILINVVVQLLQIPVNVVCFFRDQRGEDVDRSVLGRVARHYDFQDERRENWTDDYFHNRAEPFGVGVILKSREGARIAGADKGKIKPHIDLKNRFVEQYYFYLNDPEFGRAFFRICPYFPHNSRLCLNGHEWLARQLTKERIAFTQCGNAFLDCAHPRRLQELADRFSHEHIVPFAHRWLAQLVPTLTPAEQRRQGYGFRLFVSQVEYCDNIIFHERAALDRLHERLIDANRTIGRPDRLAYMFGRHFTPETAAGVKTRVTDYDEVNPVIRSQFKSTSIKQYVRDHLLLRTEATSNYTPNLGVNKGIDNLPALRQVLHRSSERYLEVQQDVMETFVDRGQLQQLQAPTVTASGRRTPGIKLTDQRLLAVMQAVVCFRFLAGLGTFRTRDLLADVLKALGTGTASYRLSQLRYDLSKLLAKGLVVKLSGTHNYQVTPTGFRLCVVYLKLFHKLYAPLTAGLLAPFPEDAALPDDQRCRLDRLYTAVDRALQDLYDHLGLQAAG